MIRVLCEQIKCWRYFALTWVELWNMQIVWCLGKVFPWEAWIWILTSLLARLNSHKSFYLCLIKIPVPTFLCNAFYANIVKQSTYCAEFRLINSIYMVFSFPIGLPTNLTKIKTLFTEVGFSFLYLNYLFLSNCFGRIGYHKMFIYLDTCRWFI